MRGAIKTALAPSRKARIALAAGALLFLIAIPVWLLYLGPALIIRPIHAHQTGTVEWFCRLGVTPNRDAWLVGGVFHCGVASGDTNIVTMMLKRGADVNRIDGYGETPLHVATQTGDLEMIKFLIQHGANSRKRNRDGITPLEVAIQRNVAEVRRYLEENGNETNKPPLTNQVIRQ